jgi:hypothetical protein
LITFCLAIAALTAIACLTVIHRAILAALLARRLICRKPNRANQRRENRKQNFGVPFHIIFNLSAEQKLRERKRATARDRRYSENCSRHGRLYRRKFSAGEDQFRDGEFNGISFVESATDVIKELEELPSEGREKVLRWLQQQGVKDLWARADALMKDVPQLRSAAAGSTCAYQSRV